MSVTTIDEIPQSIRLGLPLVASNTISSFARVQLPIPMKYVPFLFFLIQVKALVLYVNPHAFMTSNASWINGYVAHKNRTQSSSAIVWTGRSLIVCNVIKSYLHPAPRLPANALSEYVQAGSA